MNEYEKQGNDFLENNGIEMERIFHGTRTPPNWGEHPVNAYTIKLKKQNDKVMESPFYDSINNTQQYPRPIPTAYDFLACISGTYYNEDFSDFCDEYGYDTDSRTAYATWQAVNESAEKMESFFTPEELTELREIN